VPFVFGDPFATGTAVVNGQTVNAFLAGHLDFTTPSLTIPAVSPPTDADAVFTLFLPFTFRGRVTGYDRLQQGPIEPSQLFDVALLGSGTARVDLLGTSAGGVTRVQYFRTTYDFAPVPNREG
jgi:hypothetical protein